MTRRNAIVLAAAVPAAIAGAQEERNMFDDLFQTSMRDKKGLTFYVKGQTIVGMVTKMEGGFVEARNQTHSRVVIRVDSIDGVAMS